MFGRVFTEILGRRNETPSQEGPALDPHTLKILLIYLFPKLGDLILLLPVIQGLVDLGCRTPIGLLVPKSHKALWRLTELPLRIHTIEDTSKSAVALELKRIQKVHYDIAADLSYRQTEELGTHNNVRHWLKTSGAQYRIGWRGQEEEHRKTGLTHSTPDTRWQGLEHWSKTTAQPLHCLGLHKPNYNVQFQSPQKHENLERFWPTEPRVLLIPGGTTPQKHLPHTFWSDIITWLSQRDAASVLTGAPTERSALREIAKKSDTDTVQIYCGTSLSKLLALLQTADIVIANDTGPLHLAYLLRKPTLAIFSHMSPIVWGPPFPDPRFISLNFRSEVQHTDTAPLRSLCQLVFFHLEGLLSRNETTRPA